MAFPTTTIQPLTAIAKVTVKFSGLIVLKPSASNRCEIGINRFSSDHAFQVILIVRKRQRPPTLIRLITGPLTRPFAINVNPDPGTGVWAFAPTPAPFVRSDPGNNELDFRWALDLSETDPTTDFNDGAQPVATLNAGTLYTPTLTRSGLNPELVKGSTRTRLTRIAADLAAAISTLPAGRTVELTWDEFGEPRRLTLPRRLDPASTTYTIALLNEPPVMSTTVHDELSLYYKVLQASGAPIPIASRYRLTFTLGPTTDEIPCMPIVLNP